MGLLQRYISSPQNRITVNLNTKPGGQNLLIDSTTLLGSSFILLSATTNRSCILRMYSDSSSRVIDENRAPGNFNLNDSVGLIADISMSSNPTILPIIPPIIGTTYLNGRVWYSISGSLPETRVTLEVYPIGIFNDSAQPDRSTVIITGSSVPTTGYGVSGSIVTPKSFLILSGSATRVSRLRLYSTPINEVPLAEQTRSFGTQSADNSNLIADLMFDTANFQYKLVPLLEGYTWTGEFKEIGTGVTGYILENTSGVVGNISASLYLYSTED